MLVDVLTELFAIVALAVLGGVGLSYGLDGALFITVVGAIAGLGGYSIKTGLAEKKQ